MTLNNEALQTVAASLRADSDGNAHESEKSYPDNGYPGIGNRAALGNGSK
jgi:hypothetical protein